VTGEHLSSGEPLGIGLVGAGFMGAAHSLAWREAPRVFQLGRAPRMVVLAARNPATVSAAAQRWGWAEALTDWRQLLGRADIDVIDICTPGDTHAEIAVGALGAGKHVICEKPLANTVREAELMDAVARRAAGQGVRSMVAFNYRRAPALALARELVAEGRLGVLRHLRAVYLQDWLVDPDFPLTWRLQRDRAGSGALGDLGAHIVDLAQYLTGDRIEAVSALTETFVAERPLPARAGADGPAGQGLAAEASPSGRGAVTVDDAAVFLGRLSRGAVATFEATRFAAGRKNALRIELNGSRGSLAFDLEAMNELYFYDYQEPSRTGGFRRILVTEPDHPYISAWWPPGHGLGYDHTFTNEVADFVNALAAGRDPSPSFADGLAVQRVLQAVEHSAAHASAWTEVPTGS